MIRRLFTILAVLSLVLCGVVLAMWLRSYLKVSALQVGSRDNGWVFVSEDGAVHCIRFKGRLQSFWGEDDPAGEHLDQWCCSDEGKWVEAAGNTLWRPSWLGFRFSDGEIQSLGISWRFYIIPYWFPAAGATLIPAIWLIRRTRRSRIWPRLLTAAAALSLLACLATSALEARSHFRRDSLRWDFPIGDQRRFGQQFAIQADSARGRLRACFTYAVSSGYLNRFDTSFSQSLAGVIRPGDGYRHRFLGFAAQHNLYGTGGGVDETWDFVVPYPALVIFSGVLPALWLVRRRQRRKIPEGCCQICGYDLRATPDRCPECGTPVPAATSLALRNANPLFHPTQELDRRPPRSA